MVSFGVVKYTVVDAIRWVLQKHIHGLKTNIYVSKHLCGKTRFDLVNNMAIRIWKSSLLGVTIEIDYEKCKGHGKCVEECPSEVFDVVASKATCPAIDDCVECCACVDTCPENAIKHSSCED